MRRGQKIEENEAQIEQIYARLVTEKATHRVSIRLSRRLVRAVCQRVTLETVQKMDIKEFKEWCKNHGF